VYNPSLRRQGEPEFNTNLGCIARPCLKKRKEKKELSVAHVQFAY
jgi:hypothetical protein